MNDRVFWAVIKAARDNVDNGKDDNGKDLPRGITQAALAARIGVPQPRVAEWESGKHVVREDTLLAVAKALGMTLREMLRKHL